ncbi:unnamed protein product [Dovyalis caffra]|uniref:Sulfotransferase n=1 Tax=Dovyalis caffra TaxID=77055 RepID=A0AAV1RIX7_9ROSI|nr:unnamed protein product [Dovyalis caffra]
MASASLFHLSLGTCSNTNTTHDPQVIGKTGNESKPLPYSLSNHANLWKGMSISLSVPSRPTFHSFRSHGLLASTVETKPKDDLQELLPTFPVRKIGMAIYSICTTWLKALTFSVVNRNRYSPKESPLLTTPPHELVRFFEIDLYIKTNQPNLERFRAPRIFGSHTHYASLPESIRDSKCKVVYICFDNVCRGIQSHGPFWDSVLGYWKASFERPDKVLFLKYEDLKDDIVINLKRLAEFLEHPFTEEEEKEGVIEEISRLCSFDSLKSLKVNKKGVRPYSGAPNSSFFSKGEVGDWGNYMNPAMAERFTNIVEEKLAGSGLVFKMS